MTKAFFSLNHIIEFKTSLSLAKSTLSYLDVVNDDLGKKPDILLPHLVSQHKNYLFLSRRHDLSGLEGLVFYHFISSIMILVCAL